MVSRARAANYRELSDEIVRSVLQAIASGKSRRETADLHGLHRVTVNKIAAGQHVSQVHGRRFRRCPEGHLAILPCRTCAALAARNQSTSKKRGRAA
jgi:hypothetical protein